MAPTHSGAAVPNFCTLSVDGVLLPCATGVGGQRTLKLSARSSNISSRGMTRPTELESRCSTRFPHLVTIAKHVTATAIVIYLLIHVGAACRAMRFGKELGCVNILVYNRYDHVYSQTKGELLNWTAHYVTACASSSQHK